MTESLVIDPTRIFEIKGQVCEVDAIQIIAAGATNNQQVIAAVTGKKIRVMGWQVQTNGAANAGINFRDGSGGTIKSIFNAPTNAVEPYLLPITNSGYFSTTVSTGLYVDIGGATGALITVFYLYYTP